MAESGIFNLKNKGNLSTNLDGFNSRNSLQTPSRSVKLTVLVEPQFTFGSNREMGGKP